MKEKNEILFGFHSVYEALRARKRTINKIVVSKKRFGTRTGKIEGLAREGSIDVEYRDPDYLDKITGVSSHQGIAASAGLFPVKKAYDVIQHVKDNTSECFILVLESIEDPQNLGALIRSALCAGVDHILIPKDRSAQPSAAVSRSSAGAMEHADIYRITNTASLLRSLKENSVWISGLDADGDRSLFDSDLTGNIALVIGGEHKGIRPGVKKECDFILSIPNKGGINSLNASVAGGVALFEAVRQRA